jgi:hypothetical protein
VFHFAAHSSSGNCALPETKRILVAKEYTPTPAGRLRSDGPFSGQRFREEILVPALRSGAAVELNLDGMVSLPSSFWEEATGGLVRAGYAPEELRAKVKVKTTDPLLMIFVNMAEKFIADAEADTLH